jgi:hypothetical protein
MSPSSIAIAWPIAQRESIMCVHVECDTPSQSGFVIGTEELVPAKPHSSVSGALGEGVVGLRKRRSMNVLHGLVRTRVDVGSNSVGGRLSGFLTGRLIEYGTGVLGGSG